MNARPKKFHEAKISLGLPRVERCMWFAVWQRPTLLGSRFEGHTKFVESKMLGTEINREAKNKILVLF
jgi:hypothetical protein